MLPAMRHALRALSRRPGFSIAAVCTLALGIGATTTMFSVVNAVILRPLPFADPDRLIRVFETTPERKDFSASDPDYFDFAAQNRSLTGLGAFKPRDVALTGAGDPLQLHAMAVSATLFPLLGAPTAMGRVFRADEDAVGDSSRVAILSHALWSGHFRSDSAIVGRTVTLDTRSYAVIGVMPERFRFPEADVYVPLQADPRSDRNDHWLTLVGRLKPTITIDQAQTDFDAMTAGIGAIYAGSRGWGARLEPLAHVLVDGNIRRGAWVLLAATALLLMLACANVANLLLARASTRSAEMGLRAAMGASRGRLVRQLLIESGLLVGVSAVAGIFAATWGIDAVRAFGAGRIPRLDEVSVDGQAIAVATLLGVLTTFACGLAPALRASRFDLATVLGDGPRGGVSRRHRSQREALVVFQVALSIVLLTAAGLLLRSFSQLSAVEVGFDTGHSLAVNLNLPAQRYDEEARVVFLGRLATVLRGVPGVREVAATAVDPFSGWNYVNDVTPEDRAASAASSGFMQAAWRAVTPAYFSALGIPIYRGRAFTPADPRNGSSIAIVSRGLAERLWPGQDAVGKRVFWGGVDGTPRTVVGVVGDVRDVAPQAEPQPTLYLPYNQAPLPAMTLVVRTSGTDPTAMAAPVREAIRSLDPVLPVSDLHPLARNRRGAMAVQRFNLMLMTGFAVLALSLAASGIASVMAFNVARRRREIGIRLAMGAAPGGIVRSFVNSAMRLTAIGVLLGLAGGLAAGRVVSGLLFRVHPVDPVTFVGVSALVALVALLACYLPARQASRVAPMEVLGQE